MRDQLLVSGRVMERTKGGLMVDVGVPAFMPGSQVDVRPIHDLDQFVGQDIPVKILKLNRRRGNVVVSRKMAIEEDLKVAQGARAGTSCSKARWSSGTVKNLTEYGAFVDLGGIDGLLHVSDMSHGRVNHPSRSGARRRRNHRQDSEVRSRQRAHFAGPAPADAGPLGDSAASAVPPAAA